MKMLSDQKGKKKPPPRSVRAQQALWATGFDARTKLVGAVMFDSLGGQDWLIFPGVRSIRRKCSLQFNTVRRRIRLLLDCGVLTLGPQTALDHGGADFPSLLRKRKGMSRYAPAASNSYVVDIERLDALAALAEEMREQAHVPANEWVWTKRLVQSFVEQALPLPREAPA